MTSVIAISNNKGGSGKTTMVSNLAYSLSKMGKKVLVIDSDMQINLTRSFDMKGDLDNSLYAALHFEDDLKNYIKRTKYENVDIVISDYMLSAIDMELVNKENKEMVFKKSLENSVNCNLYDYILIDTSPYLGLLNFNVMVASDYVLIPVELSSFGIEGLHPLTNFVSEAMVYNEDLEIMGIVETKVDNRESTTEETRKLLRQLFEDFVLPISIPVDINIKKSQFLGMTISDFSEGSRASLAYESLAKEVEKIVKQKVNN